MSTVSGATLDKLRLPHQIRRYISVSPGTQVYVGLVTSVTKDADTNGIVQLSHTAITGSHSNVKIYYTVWVGTSAGLRNVGELRVRKLPTSSDFYVNEVAPAEVDVQVGHYITVIEERRIWQKRMKHIEVINPGETFPSSYEQRVDYDIVYSNQNTNGMPPKANITRTDTSRQLPPLVAGFVENGASYRVVNLSAFYSYATASGASISSYLWDVDDGTIIVGTSTSHTITVTFPNTKVFRYISLTVTDSNGTTGVMFLPIWVHDRTGANAPLSNFRVTKDERSEGRSMTFEFFGLNNEADYSKIPHGSVICYWEEIFWETYEFNTPPDEYIRQFLGWIIKRTENLRYQQGKLTLECGGPQAVLSKIYGYAQTVSDPGTAPTAWYEMNNITLNRLVTYMLRVYSNAVNLMNVFLTARADPIEGFEFDNSNIWDQIVKIIERGYFSVAHCDSLGSLWMQRHYSYFELGDRPFRQTTMALASKDWEDASGLDIADETLKKVWWIEAYGSNHDILLDNNNNVVNFSKVWKVEAPGKTQSYGLSSPTTPLQHLKVSEDAKNDLAKLIGHHYARENNLRDNVTLKLLWNFDVIEPAWNEPITITYTAGTVGGASLNNAEFLVKSISVTHNSEYGRQPKEMTLTLEQATIGKPAEITDVEDAGLIGSGNTGQPISIGRPPTEFGTGTLALFTSDNGLLITHNASATNPTWERFSLAVDGKVYDAVPDPFSPLYLQTGTTVNGWFSTGGNGSTAAKIYTIDDIFGAKIVTERFVISASVGGAIYPIIDTERGTRNFVVVVASNSDTGNLEVYRTTNGTSWSGPVVLEAWTAFGSTGMYVSPRSDGRVYVSPVAGATGFVSSNYGASFGNLTSPDLGVSGTNSTVGLHFPYHNNDAEQIAYVGVAQGGFPNFQYRLYRVSGTTQTDITPDLYGPANNTHKNIDTPALDSNRLVVCGLLGRGDGGLVGRVYASRDRGATWSFVPGTENIGTIFALPTAYLTVRCSGDNPDVFYIMGEPGLFAMSSDFGQTLQDKRGNMPTDYPGTERIVNVIGG